jgi:hypothetical protein
MQLSVARLSSADQPADTSNWLPGPCRPVRPIMRLYQPQAAVLDGTYQIPPITKAAV